VSTSLHDIINSPIAAIFIGTLPLLGTILWGFLNNDRRFSRVEVQLERLNTRLSERVAKSDGKGITH
jgi:hypothetical protein